MSNTGRNCDKLMQIHGKLISNKVSNAKLSVDKIFSSTHTIQKNKIQSQAAKCLAATRWRHLNLFMIILFV